MPLVVGVDSSTSACKVEVRDADTGERVSAGWGVSDVKTPVTQPAPPADHPRGAARSWTPERPKGLRGIQLRAEAAGRISPSGLQVARAAFEGVVCNLLAGADALGACSGCVILVGGGARSLRTAAVGEVIDPDERVDRVAVRAACAEQVAFVER